MDKNIENSLIANSGLHFMTTYLDFNPDQPLMLANGKTLKYTFIETIDFLNDCRVRVDLCTVKDAMVVPITQLIEQKLIEEKPDTTFEVDEGGVPKIKSSAVLALLEHYQPGDPDAPLVNMNALTSYKIKKDHSTVPAFDMLLGKWLPMPMFEQELSGQSTGYPTGWCRVRIDAIGEKTSQGKQKFRFTWAFDTQTAEDALGGVIRPAFLLGSGESKTYSLCNRADMLLGGFLNIPDGQNDAPIGDYLVSLLGIDLRQDQLPKYKFIAFYVYLVNYLRLSGAAPVVTLINPETAGREDIPVDMSVDIGNSRTCAVLFERGNFTKARMLQLRDLTHPWDTYDNAFDMRIVFRRADFGGDITLDKSLFQWQSLVRVGEEAKHLVYNSLEVIGRSQRSTNYSSPKRYLWDDRAYKNQWELLVVNDDPTNLKINPQIFIEGFTDHFDNDGKYLPEAKQFDIFADTSADKECHYSRQSLMTFVMVEIMQQARAYINSTNFRGMHGEYDCRRYLRNIIITCPTAMPMEEQRALRQAAKDASSLMSQLNPTMPQMTITPDPSKLKASDDPDVMAQRGWTYDEALANQLVYLYAELTERYGGHIDHFFRLKGHERQDMAMRGFSGNSLTIGTIDIGAGTTDVMVTAFGQKGQSTLVPVPVYYDSFYTAGDDILHNVIRDLILEGKNNESPTLGSISSALTARILSMSMADLWEIPRIRDTKEYQEILDKLSLAADEREERRIRLSLAQELMHHFFAANSSLQSEKDRQCRLDFCTQVTHPMSQFFLECLNQKRPTRLYSFNDLFPREKPAAYLLDHFAYHFGFRFEELEWRYVPEETGAIVRDTVEPLIKALSVIMYAYHCDILVLSGRPTNLEPLTELFLKYIPIAPNRLVLLNQYRVGRWYPLSTQQGYFQEKQKAVVAVGAEVGFIASTVGFNGLVLDFSILAKEMQSTARYLGAFDSTLQEVPSPFLSPVESSATVDGISTFPFFIGCKQFNAPKYQARPLFALYNRSSHPQLCVNFERDYNEDREKVRVESVTDMEGNNISMADVDLRLQTIAGDGNFWLDEGAFSLKIQEH